MDSATLLAVALAVLCIILVTLVMREQKKAGSSGGSKASSSAQDEQQARRDASILQGLNRLPVQILYATKTGTARRFAEDIRREAFAFNVSGFHFAVTATDLAQYNVENMVDERLVIVLLPTYTGGTPPPTGVGLMEHLRDMLTDFRVDRNALQKLRFAVFGLGSKVYLQSADGADHWCRAAVELYDGLQGLGAEPLCELGKGDDTDDMEAAFKGWLTQLWPSLCEVYAEECGDPEAAAAAKAAAAEGATRYGQQDGAEEEGGCGSSSCACGKKSGGSGEGGCCQSGDGGGSGSCSCGGHGKQKEWLPLKEHRRRKRAAAEAAQREAAVAAARAAALASAASQAGGSGSGSGSGGAGASAGGGEAGEGGDEWTEEDAINERILQESDRMLAAMEAVESKKKSSAGAGIAELVDSDDEGEGTEDEGDTSEAAIARRKLAAAAAARARGGSGGGEGLVDLEDMGSVIARAVEERKKEEEDSARGAAVRDMITPAQRKALTKEGYKIIGTHSAVKLCRWTKAQLRGRGGCYKHTAYGAYCNESTVLAVVVEPAVTHSYTHSPSLCYAGITSYQCMEMTPNLSCANKCTFCWRHHRNPVGREWRWRTDEPELIVSEAIAKHTAMINEFKGTPGVKMDRWQEAFTVRHCALSLVGEPIFYPHINRLLRLLHERRISSFLVTNAQFPEAIETLEPVTQLYVSVDAATKETLRAIDRPLFHDFWERFMRSLDLLASRALSRTVFRMTLVKGGNMAPEHLDAYMELVQRGKPDFIEIKGVTWCGKSDASDMTMANVPWHAEVRAYCQALADRTGGEYELACEHAHSCFVLLAKKQFKIDGQWHTHINYDRFHELVARWHATGGKATFTALDYCAPTPHWALFGAEEEGFDPVEMRHRRKADGGVTEIDYKPSESGCG